MTERETTSWWLRPARGFDLALSLTVSAAMIFGFAGALGWRVGVPLRWTAAFVGAVCALEVAGLAIVLLAGAALVLVGAAAPRLFVGALAPLAIGYFASVRRGAHALTRLAGHEVEVRSRRLVAEGRP